METINVDNYSHSEPLGEESHAREKARLVRDISLSLKMTPLVMLNLVSASYQH